MIWGRYNPGRVQRFQTYAGHKVAVKDMTWELRFVFAFIGVDSEKLLAGIISVKVRPSRGKDCLFLSFTSEVAKRSSNEPAFRGG